MPVGFANLVNWGAGKDVVLPAFAAFQAARVEFAQEVAKLALPPDPANKGSRAGELSTYEVDGPEKVLEALEASFLLAPEMRSLLNDIAPTVRENAMLAVGRLCGLSDKLHAELAGDDTLLSSVIGSISAGQSPALVSAAMYLLHAAVRASPEAANMALERNALGALVERLEDNDAAVKQGSVWCLSAFANHDASLAAAVADAGALPLLLLCLKEHSLPLRRITLSCLGVDA